jgi:hypothetical protein
MPHSGMAMRLVSQTIRCEAWQPTPTPPPMVKPCRKETTGLGKLKSLAFIRYSSAQKRRP